MKYNKKNAKNVFTKKEGNDIIKKKCNPFINRKVVYERDELHMRNKETNQKEEFIKLLFKICTDLGIENSEYEVERFLSQKQMVH